MTDPQNTQNQGTGGVDPNKPVNAGNSAVSGQKKRRRRRRKKPAFTPGQDVPLILSEKKVEDTVPQTLNQPLPEPTEPTESVAPTIYPEMGQEEETPAEPAEISYVEPSPFMPVETPPAPAQVPPSEETSPVTASLAPSEEDHSEPAQVPDYAPLPEDQDQSRRIFEEKHQPPEWQDEPLEERISPETNPPQPEEHAAKQASLDQAKQISESLLREQPAALEELPQKQGIFGKIFNVLERIVHGREEVEAAKIEVAKPAVSEMPRGPGFLVKLIKLVFKLAILAALIIGAFWVGSSLKLMDRLNGLITPKQGLELVKSDNSRVVVDQEMFKKWGFMTAVTFGRNQGDLRDLTYNIFFNANYFGRLMDPMFFGQTGISAAVYYGFGRDAEYIKNRYIYYVKYLAKIRFANLVKVSDVLDGKVRRDQALDKFIGDTQTLFNDGNKLRKEILVQVDDLKISVNSLTADKDRYEIDYFASVDQTQAEKSETLLNKFIDASQKMVELKAKLAALTKLSQLYEADLLKMKIKLDDMIQNRDALISGVTVKQVPGSDLNLIRQ